ncbi:MAG TPA: hypothetical protein VGF69_01020 [Thermoanaerobaculia bacterium]|jgi:photosystem II stability/assembly factor-like uncharacterized protein
MIRRLLPLLAALPLACAHQPVEPPRFDEPGAAQRFYEMKRQGTVDPQAAYAKARAQIRERERNRRIQTEAQELQEWDYLGPGNIGGRTRVLVIDPNDTNVMYAGAVSGGIFKTTNGGANWTAIGDDLANLTVNSLAMSPSDSRVLFAGTGEGFFREEQRGTGLPLRGNGMYVTRDAGATWTHLDSTSTDDFHWVNDLIVSRHDPRRIYAATRSGVWRSGDEGASWTHVLPTTVKGGCLDLAARTDQSEDYLFASCGTFQQATIYRTTNGQTWTPVHTEQTMGRTSLAIAPSNQSIIYALSASNQPGTFNQGLLAVYRSDQNGDPGTWTARVRNTDPNLVNSTLLTNPLGATRTLCGYPSNNFTTMGWYCNTIAVDPADPDKVWAAGVDLFRSDDGGRNWGVGSYWWAPEDNPNWVHADQHSIVFHPQYDGTANKTMFVTNDGGVARTLDARAGVATGSKATCGTNADMSWESLNHDYGATQFYHGAVFPNGRRFLGGAQDNGTIFGSVDSGPNRWTRQLGGDGSYAAIDFENPNIIYAQSQVGTLYQSFDGGQVFNYVGNALTGDQYLFIAPLQMDPNTSRRVWIGGRHLWRTDNKAETWTVSSPLVDGLVSAIGIAPGRSDRVVAGTNTGALVRTDNATTATFQTAWTATKPRNGFVSWIAFDPTNVDVVYATYAGFGGQHLYKSVDGGVTWGELQNDLPDIPVHSMVVDPTRPQRLFLGTDLGVFVSTNGGTNWQVENTGFAAVVTEALILGQGEWGPAVYAFTHGRGAWKTELTPMPTAPRRRRAS